ncbi:MAG: TPM domain-containing protein, partial [Eggerthellaceae bacterium]|nr:TPM domain-containing protein [Eggerthellaceae bacterium]
MKSLKKLSAVLLSLVLSFSVMGVPATAFAAVQRDSSVSQAISSDYYALDQEGLLSSSDVKALNQTGKSLKSNYGVGAYFITVSDFGNNADAGAYADAFVEAYGLETANGQRGCLVFVVSKGEREYEVRAYGAAKNTFSDDVIDYLIKELFPYLGRADWSGAAETFFSDAEQTLSGKQANSSSTVPYTQGTYVIDNYGLFSDEQREKLESTAQNFASTYGMGVYLLVVDYMQDSNGKNLSNPSSAQRTNFATSFYRANGLGLNKASEKYGDGIMLVLAVKSRDYVTIAYGQGSYSFN